MKKIFYGWWIVTACFLIVFSVAGTTFYGFTAFVEPIAKEFGWSYTKVSLAASLRGLEMGILAPIVGLLVDRFGSRKLLVSGVVILGFGMFLLGFVRSLPMFYGAFLLIAFGAGGCTSVVTMTAVANWFERNVGKAMGIMASGFGASGILVPLIVWLIHAHGWRAATIALGVGLWGIGIPLAFLVRNRPEDYGEVPDGRHSGEPISRGSESALTSSGFWGAVRRRSFVCLNLAEIIRMMSLAAVVTHIMPYLANIGVPRTEAGFVAAGIPLLSIFGRFGFGWLGDLFEKRRVIAVAYVLMAIGMLAFWRARTNLFVYLFLFFFPTGFGGLAVLRGAFLREYFGRDSFGKLLGAMMGISAVGGIAGPTLAGWVFDTRGTYDLIWLVLFGLMGIAVFLTLLVEPHAASVRSRVESQPAFSR